MNNISILNNFPIEIQKKFLDYYNNNLKNKEPEKKWSPIHHSNDLDIKHHFDLYNLFPIKPIKIDFYYVYYGFMTPHIDRGRRTALQIPIQIDLNNSYTFSSKYNDLSKCIVNNVSNFSNNNVLRSKTVNIVDNYFYQYVEEDYDRYNLEKPIIQNAAMPHGGVNLSNTTRIFLSVSFIEEFNLMKEILKEWI